jgi:hypothetical protein
MDLSDISDSLESLDDVPSDLLHTVNKKVEKKVSAAIQRLEDSRQKHGASLPFLRDIHGNPKKSKRGRPQGISHQQQMAQNQQSAQNAQMMAMNYNGPQYYLQKQMQFMMMMKLFGNNNNSSSNKTIQNHSTPNNVSQQGLSQVDPDITGQYKEKMQNMNHLIQQQEISKLQNLYQKQVNYYENLNFENGEHSKQKNWQDPIGSDHPMISYLMDELDRKNKMVHKYRNGKQSGGDHYRTSGKRNKTGGSHPGVFRLTPSQRVTDEKIRMRPQGIALPELKKIRNQSPKYGQQSCPRAKRQR